MEGKGKGCVVRVRVLYARLYHLPVPAALMDVDNLTSS